MLFNVEKRLNAQNADLLLDLRKTIPVKFKRTKKPYFEVSVINNRASIFVNPKIFNNSHVAHELLHVWFARLGLHGSNLIYLRAKEKPIFAAVFDRFLCDHIGNCMAHNKIYPMFLEMGYAPEDFLISSDMQCDIDRVRCLCIQRNGIYSAIQVNCYIGYLISIYADHLPHDYSQHLKLLYNFEPELFDMVSGFWRAWKDVDVTNPSPLTRDEFSAINGFINDFEEWATNKPLVISF